MNFRKICKEIAATKAKKKPGANEVATQKRKRSFLMKLLIVMPSGQRRGGAEESLLQYVTCCSQAGRATTVAVLEEGPLLEDLRNAGAEVIVVASGQIRQLNLWVKAVGQLERLAQQRDVDLIFSWMTKAHLYGAPAARKIGKPAAYFQHGLPDNGFIDRACRFLPAVGAVGCSRFVAREQQKNVKHPVLPVLMAADLTRFDAVRDVAVAEMKIRLGFDPARPLLGMVGRLQHWKGMHVFATAFAEVKKTRPDVQGVIVGGPHLWEPEYESFLQNCINELGVADDLQMVGVQRNVPEWMQAMDVMVHASMREPFGIVIVEAMALGKPVIATVPGGPAEIIEPNVNGQLVSWNEPQELARAMENFLAETDFATSCGGHAAVRARHFSPEIFSINLDNALRSFIAKITAI